MKKQPKLIILTGPSGTGKSTLAAHLLMEIPDLEFSISACSRPKRPYEKNGVHYYFLSAEKFKEKIIKNEFIEWEEVYKNQFYGTLKSEIERIVTRNHHAIFDVDVVGGLHLKKIFGEQALAIIIIPPSIDELEKRLKKRSTEDKNQFKKRMDKARKELEFADKFDKVILNSDLDCAKVEITNDVRKFLGI